MSMFVKMESFLIVLVVAWTTASILGADVYRISRQKTNWRNARDQCSMFGGELATLENLGRFRNDVLDKQIDVTIDSGQEFWIGANLTMHGWKWLGKTSGVFHEEAHTYDRRGCFKQQYWLGGIRQDNISPVTCLTHCNWQGIVGLKKDYCMCADDLKNISLTEFGICNLRCTGSNRDMCGGIHGVSVYQKGIAVGAITWATGEPQPDNDCVFLRKSDDTSTIELVSANCQLQMRYLCHFEDEKCGLSKSCLRWSTTQATWSGAAHNCHMLGGFFAELSTDSTDGLPKLPTSLPPGSFWLSLKRDRSWEWTTGKPVYMAHFFTSERVIKPKRACAVLARVGDDLAFAAKECNTNSHYLCKYDSLHTDAPVSESTQRSPTITSFTSHGGPVPRDRTNNVTELLDTWPYAVLDVAAVSGGDNHVDDVDDEDDDSSTLLTTCMYVILGFVSGMVCVLIVGLIVYLMYRWRNPEKIKKDSQVSTREGAGPVSYAANSDSVRISQPRSSAPDVTYDSVYDLEGESPFRRTQRLIRMGSATSWRQPPPRRDRTDTGGSINSRDYTWRGMIGGKLEVINTQLRQPEGNQPLSITYNMGSAPGTYDRNVNSINKSTEKQTYPSASLGAARRFPGITIQTNFPHQDVNYDLAGPSTQSMQNAMPNARASAVSTGSDKNFAFLELESKTDDLSNEENIYATIKKTFERLKERENDAEGWEMPM